MKTTVARSVFLFGVRCRMLATVPFVLCDLVGSGGREPPPYGTETGGREVSSSFFFFL